MKKKYQKKCDAEASNSIMKNVMREYNTVCTVTYGISTSACVADAHTHENNVTGVDTMLHLQRCGWAVFPGVIQSKPS